MKNSKGIFLKIVPLLCALGLLCACTAQTQNAPTKASVTSAVRVPQIIADEDYYRITKTDGGFQYIVYDNSGNVLAHGVATRPPEIGFISASVLRFSLQTGTGRSTQWSFYYDAATDRKSQTFQEVLDESGGKIAYVEKGGVAVQSIFDAADRQVFSDFNPPLGAAPDAVLSAAFSQNGKQLLVRYCDADGGEYMQRFTVSA